MTDGRFGANKYVGMFNTNTQSQPPRRRVDLPCPKDFTLTPKQPPLSREMDMGKFHLPKHLKYSSMVKDNDIEMIRQRLRKNRIFHLQFDRELDNNEGRVYYTGVYEPNNPAHIKGNPLEIEEP